MAFKVFKQTGARTKEYISVTDNKAFGLPRTFLNKQGITNKHKAVLLYDEDERKIALHFTLADPQFGIRVRIPNDKQGGVVFARTFFDLNSIDAVKYSGRYADFQKMPLRDLGVDKAGDAYVITLREKHSQNIKNNQIVEEQEKNEADF